MEKWEITKEIAHFKNKLNDLNNVIDVEQKKSEIAAFDIIMAASDFWDDNNQAQAIIKKSNDIKEVVDSYEHIVHLTEELVLIIQFDDEELLTEASSLILQIRALLSQFEQDLLLNEDYDQASAIVDIHPGAGGTESQDWAKILYRMYFRFCERMNYKFELVDYLDGNEAGIKGATFLVKAKYAYGRLKSEHGVHRLVRISPFDAGARRHTSFAAVHVTPEIDEDIEVNIAPEHLKIDTYRSSGAGGQHVNTTDSAVRITHLPTGIVVSCQNERSQIQNREQAMKILKSKIYQLNRAEQEKKIRSIGGTIEDNAFGSQIRSYVLHPYSLVKDHRTDVESTNPTNVLDGDIDLFIDAYLKHSSKENK